MEVGARYCSTLYELLAQSDHVVLLSGAELLMDAAALARMRRGAKLINMGRGGLVCCDALAAAMDSGQVSAAGLDMTAPEPLPADHPLLAQPRCTILPHRGSAARFSRDAMAARTVEHLMMGLEGKVGQIETLVDWVE